jgi:hypothetical protein
MMSTAWAEDQPSGMVTKWRTTRPSISRRMTALSEARLGTSYSPARRRRSAPVKVAAALNMSTERITPAFFRVAAMAETPEPDGRVTMVASPCRADGPGA